MHESIAKSLLAKYKRKVNSQAERYNAKADLPLPKSRRAWFKAALHRATHTPGSYPIAYFDVEGSQPYDRRKGKTLRVDLMTLEPVEDTRAPQRQLNRFAWVVSIVRIDAKKFDLSKMMTKIWISSHAIERTLQRMDFVRVEDALEYAARAVTTLPSAALKRKDLDILMPVERAGEMAGAYGVRSDKRDGTDRIIFTTFVSAAQMPATQVRSLEGTVATMKTQGGPLMCLEEGPRLDS